VDWRKKPARGSRAVHVVRVPCSPEHSSTHCSDSFASRAVSTVPTLGTVPTRYSDWASGRTTQESRFDSLSCPRRLELVRCVVVTTRFWIRVAMPHLPICLYGVVLNQLLLLHLGKGCWRGQGRGVSSALLNTRLLSFWTCCISDEPDGTDNSGLDCSDF